MWKDGDVLFAVGPRVLVVEAQRVQDLVDNVTHDALCCNEHRLLAANEADIWRTAETEWNID